LGGFQQSDANQDDDRARRTPMPMMTAGRSRSQWVCQAMAVGLVLLLLASVARLYHPLFGFTEMIGFASGRSGELPVLRTIPHYLHPPWGSYDGQYYAQLALEPLLRDPAIDRALDLPPYRARRILFSWSAWALGLGRPQWILQAYALQNVLFWLLLAALMTRWLRPDTPRGLALWTACLFSHGLLHSVRAALLDGPSMLLIALAIAASERGRLYTSAAILGVSGLGRETNLLAAFGLPWPEGRRPWVKVGAALALAAVPLLLWQDYLRSIYRSTAAAQPGALDRPVIVYLQVLQQTLGQVFGNDASLLAALKLGVIVCLAVQTAYLLYRREYHSPWWRVALPYALLMLTVHKVVWDGYPGAVTRVTLPLVFGFNVLLAREEGPRFWPWFILGNLHLLPAAMLLRFHEG
jgi:hypothetical protein